MAQDRLPGLSRVSVLLYRLLSPINRTLALLAVVFDLAGTAALIPSYVSRWGPLEMFTNPGQAIWIGEH